MWWCGINELREWGLGNRGGLWVVAGDAGISNRLNNNRYGNVKTRLQSLVNICARRQRGKGRANRLEKIVIPFAPVCVFQRETGKLLGQDWPGKTSKSSASGETSFSKSGVRSWRRPHGVKLIRKSLRKEKRQTWQMWRVLDANVISKYFFGQSPQQRTACF